VTEQSTTIRLNAGLVDKLADSHSAKRAAFTESAKLLDRAPHFIAVDCLIDWNKLGDRNARACDRNSLTL
jgi:hypothetical protein